MCFKKKTVSDGASVSERAKPYIERKKLLSELDLKKTKDIEVLRYCLDRYPAYAQDLNLSADAVIPVLKEWIKGDYYHEEGNPFKYKKDYSKYLESRLDHIELLTLYLNEKLKDTLSADIEGLSFITSYDKKLVLNYRYETRRGETISYFDGTLGMPTSLVVAANARLKLINAQKLVEKVDVDIHYIDAALVANFVAAALNKTVRDTVLSFIAAKNLSFYDLPQYYTALNQAVLDKLNEYLGACGLEATDFSVSDISVPNNTDELLKNQFFAIAEAERVKMHEQKMEKASLDLYERKAAIHSKYPDFPITLTEAEKDFALNRYLTRTGHDTTLKADIKEENLKGRKVVNGGTPTTERKISLPTLIKTSNKFRIIYGLAVAAMFIVAVSMFSINLRAGFIALACATFASGVSAACSYKKLKYGTQTQQTVEYSPETPYENARAEAAVSADGNGADAD